MKGDVSAAPHSCEAEGALGLPRVWLGIAVSIALAIPFGIDFTQKALLPLDRNWFVGWDVLAIGTVSIGLGTVVFLQCETAMRRSVRKVNARDLSPLSSTPSVMELL